MIGPNKFARYVIFGGRKDLCASLSRPVRTGSYHCHFPAERPTFSPAGSCLLTPSADQSVRPFSAPRRPDPQRGAASPAVRHMRAPHRRISIRVATLGEAGQFSPVRGIGPSFVRLRSTFVPVFVHPIGHKRGLFRRRTVNATMLAAI